MLLRHATSQRARFCGLSIPRAGIRKWHNQQFSTTSATATDWDDEYPIRQCFMKNALKAIKEDGWNQASLHRASTGANLSPASSSMYTLLDVSYHFMDLCNDAIVASSHDLTSGVSVKTFAGFRST
eukprot:GHVN01083350.1.p1 GENE.GHVN01083350.1~~GHVN01083350.1.p1  ORF type:complete len:126 (+),score=9.41 GHVN01083350.1:57-434(+)